LFFQSFDFAALFLLLYGAGSGKSGRQRLK